MVDKYAHEIYADITVLINKKASHPYSFANLNLK